MRKMPMMLAALFIIISLARVAQFSWQAMQAGWLGILFAVGLGAAVYVSAYNLRVHVINGSSGKEDRRSKSTRMVALAALVLFMFADGIFNLWEVLRTVTDPNLRIAAYIYGLFPTIGASVLGLLQGRVDKLPIPPQKHSISALLRARIAARLRMPEIDAPQGEGLPYVVIEAAPHAALQNGRHARIPCLNADCKETFESKAARAAHMRWHHPVTEAAAK